MLSFYPTDFPAVHHFHNTISQSVETGCLSLHDQITISFVKYGFVKLNFSHLNWYSITTHKIDRLRMSEPESYYYLLCLPWSWNAQVWPNLTNIPISEVLTLTGVMAVQERVFWSGKWDLDLSNGHNLINLQHNSRIIQKIWLKQTVVLVVPQRCHTNRSCGERR